MITYLDPGGRWPGLRSLAKVTAQRTTGTTTSRESRYYLSRLPDDPVRLNQIVRTHWRIENELH